MQARTNANVTNPTGWKESPVSEAANTMLPRSTGERWSSPDYFENNLNLTGFFQRILNKSVVLQEEDKNTSMALSTYETSVNFY
jgi:hypothetical protein